MNPLLLFIQENFRPIHGQYLEHEISAYSKLKLSILKTQFQFME